MGFYIIKLIFTASLIVCISEIAKLSDKLGGLIAALPLTTFLVIFWMYIDGVPDQKISNHMVYTFFFVLPTLPMFLFFPLPAGVLLYMVVANIFQAFQTFLLNKESLPENLQKILDQQLLNKNEPITTSATNVSEKRLPFEPNSKK